MSRLFKASPRAWRLLILSIAVLAGSLAYAVGCAVTDVDRASSDDGRYQICLQEAGRANVFRNTSHARLVLSDENGVVRIVTVDADNGGRRLSEDDWSVSWQRDCVQVTISGEGQGGALCRLYFSGGAQCFRL